jgi:hypothetical protein
MVLYARIGANAVAKCNGAKYSERTSAVAALYKDETEELGKMNSRSSISFRVRFGGPRISQAA